MPKTKKTEAKERLAEWIKTHAPCVEMVHVNQDGEKRIVRVGIETPELDEDLRILVGIDVEGTAELVTSDRLFPRSIERKKTTLPLRVKLTDAEKIKAGDYVADAIARIQGYEADLASLKKQFQGQIEGAKAEIASRSETIRNGYEIRPVECVRALDFDLGKVQEFRTDTNDMIDSRRMSDDERVQELRLFPYMAAMNGAQAGDTGDGEPGQGEGAGSAPGMPDGDPGPSEDDFAKTIDILKDTKRASTTTIQRRLQVGFTTATRIMDALEAKGIVGPADGTGAPREILVDLETLDAENGAE